MPGQFWLPVSGPSQVDPDPIPPSSSVTSIALPAVTQSTCTYRAPRLKAPRCREPLRRGAGQAAVFEAIFNDTSQMEIDGTRRPRWVMNRLHAGKG